MADPGVFNPQVATVNDNEVDILDKCVAMMYKSSTTTGVNNARLDMFAQKQRPYQGIPPTRSALLQRVKRAAYQADSIYGPNQHCASQEHRALLTGDGRRMEICGM